MKTSPLRAALIGCGRIGAGCSGIGQSRLQSHAAAYTACEGTKLVAACDPDEKVLACMNEKWGIERLYRDAQDMIQSEDPEVVSICTPAASHLSLMREVVAPGSLKRVLLEKPVASTPEEAAEIGMLAKANNVTVAVNYARRYAPVYQAVAKAFQEGQYGDIQHIQVVYTKGIVNNGSHVLDLLRFLFGDPDGFAVVNVISPVAEDPEVSFRVVYQDRFEAWISCVDSSQYNVFDMDVFGTRGRLRFTDLGHKSSVYNVEDVREIHGFRQLKMDSLQDTGLSTATGRAVSDVLDAEKESRLPICTIRDGALALSMAVEIAEAAVLDKKLFHSFVSLKSGENRFPNLS